MWHTIVRYYMSKASTFEKDVFLALQGITKQMHLTT
jgi:hypothetical protein